MTDSLDILEECLLTIYTIRKESLQYRILKGRQNRSRNIQTPKKDSRRVTLPGDEDIGELIDTSNPALENLHSSKSSPGGDSKNWILGDPSLLKDVKVTTVDMPVKNATDYVKPSKGITKEEKADILPQDPEAMNAFDDFCREIDRWWNESSLQTKDNDEERELFADYLCDKYMCQRLDPLPPSKHVTQIRKNISRIIDDFAMKGELSTDVQQYKSKSKLNTNSSSANVKSLKQKLDMQGKPKDEHSTGKITIDTKNNDASKSLNAMTPAAGVTKVGETSKESKLSIEQVVTAKGVVKTQVDKRELEKQKIKEQYEAYMKIKGKTETHPDTAKTKLYEENLDEIKNLLSSIRAPPK